MVRQCQYLWGRTAKTGFPQGTRASDAFLNIGNVPRTVLELENKGAEKTGFLPQATHTLRKAYNFKKENEAQEENLRAAQVGRAHQKEQQQGTGPSTLLSSLAQSVITDVHGFSDNSGQTSPQVENSKQPIQSKTQR